MIAPAKQVCSLITASLIVKQSLGNAPDKETAKDDVLQQGLLKAFYKIYLKADLPKYNRVKGWPTPVCDPFDTWGAILIKLPAHPNAGDEQKCEALIKHPKTDYRHGKLIPLPPFQFLVAPVRSTHACVHAWTPPCTPRVVCVVSSSE